MLKNIFYVNIGDIRHQIANLFFEKNPKNSQLAKFCHLKLPCFTLFHLSAPLSWEEAF